MNASRLRVGRVFRRLAFVGALATVALAGCGGSGVPVTTAPRPAPLTSGPQSCTPPEGQGVAGACAKRSLKLAPRGLHVGGCPIPDVSEYQPSVNWRAAKAHICGVVLRVGDGHYRDRVFGRYLREVRALRIYHAIYIYLRPWYPSCAAEADYALAAIPGGVDSGPLIGDAETALNPGCLGQFGAEVERRTGWRVTVDYSSAGTYPGGARPGDRQWDAAYGPSAGCFFSPCRRVAWQHTDGVIGPDPRCIPGMGCLDVSRDEGLSAIVASKPAPKPTRRALIQRRDRLRALILQHQCQYGHGRHATPHGYRHRCNVWLAHGRQVNRELH